MSSSSLLLLFFLSACGSTAAPSTPAAAGEEAARDEPASAEKFEHAAPGSRSVVTVSIDVENAPASAAISLAGVPEGDIAGSWIEAGIQPAFWWSRPSAPLTDSIVLDVRLAVGLHYYVVISADGNDVPDPGDFVGGPVQHREDGAPLALTVDRPFGAAPSFVVPGPYDEPKVDARVEAAPGEDAESDRKPGVGHPVRISSDVAMEFVKTGRIVVSGYEPSEDEPGPPVFHWLSEELTLDWPLELNAPLPEGLDVVVALDLDGSGAADAGDLATIPLRAWAPGSGAAELVLSEVLPAPPQ